MAGKRKVGKIMMLAACVIWLASVEAQAAVGTEYLEEAGTGTDAGTGTAAGEEGKAGTGTEIEEPEIAATELDLGAYRNEMTVGETQLLAVTVLPLNATDQTVVYSSGDPTVATINGLGRITALAAGETRITAVCGSAGASFTLTVEEEKTQEIVGVTDIEIADHPGEVEVGSTMTLNATVLPRNALDAGVTYRSSDSGIASVNSSGEVKGIAKGTAVIYCSAGYVTKEIEVTVKVATEKLSVEKNYLVMKPGETFALKAAVTPAEAPQEITYQVSEPSVASVSASGVVSAKSCGNTSLLVSNGDAAISVSVIVNESGRTESTEESEAAEIKKEEVVYENETAVSQNKVIPAEMLKYFYDKKSILTIIGEDYTLYVDGNDVVNYKNELYTELAFEEGEEGISFVLNRREELCGPITLKLEEKMGNYLYLYNDSKEKYELIQTETMQDIRLTSAGRYLITQEKRSDFCPDKRLMGVGGAGVVLLLGAYIVMRRKYWFW